MTNVKFLYFEGDDIQGFIEATNYVDQQAHRSTVG